MTVLSKEQARKRLGVSIPTLDKIITSSNGPRTMRLGRRVMIDASSLDDWISARMA